MEPRVYSPNSGQFRKGMTPWNKSTKSGGRKDAKKGACGFQPKEVVAINPDGTVYKRFSSVEKAKDFFGLRDRHSITRACQGKCMTRGMRLMYGEDYIPWADYRYPKRRFRDIYGRLLPGHHNVGFKQPSEEKRRLQSERMRRISYKMVHDPDSKWGKPKYKPVVCIETGEHFPSYLAACAKFGLKSNQISSAISRGGKCHGLTFKKTSEFNDK